MKRFYVYSSAHWQQLVMLRRLWGLSVWFCKLHNRGGGGGVDCWLDSFRWQPLAFSTRRVSHKRPLLKKHAVIMWTGKGGFTRWWLGLEFIKFIKLHLRPYSCQAASKPDATSEVPYLGHGVFPEDYSRLPGHLPPADYSATIPKYGFLCVLMKYYNFVLYWHWEYPKL